MSTDPDAVSCAGCGRALAPYERFCGGCGRPRPEETASEIVNTPFTPRYASPPGSGDPSSTEEPSAPPAGGYHSPPGSSTPLGIPPQPAGGDQPPQQPPGYPPPAYQPPQQQPPVYGPPGYQQPQQPAGYPPSGYPPPGYPPPGYPPPGQPYGQQYVPGYPPQAQGGQVMAIISLVLGIISLPAALFFPIVAVPAGVVGLVLGIIGRRSQSRGVAIAGIVLSSVGLGLAVIIFVIGFIIAIRNLQAG